MITPSVAFTRGRLASALLLFGLLYILCLGYRARETFAADDEQFVPEVPMDGVKAPDDAALNDKFPGSDEGFQRGVNEQGAEVYRIEQENQVYIIPANDYYAWREQHYENHLTNEILQILLISSMFHALSYPRTTYYSSHTYFGAPTVPYYQTTSYNAHFSTPVMHNGVATYPPASPTQAAAARAQTTAKSASSLKAWQSRAASGQRPPPVAQGRPISAASVGKGGTPVVQGKPSSGSHVSTHVAQARPVSSSHSTSSWGSLFSSRAHPSYSSSHHSAHYGHHGRG